MAAVIGNSRNVTGCRMAADERPTIGATKTTRMTAGYVDPSTVDAAPSKRELARKAAAEARAEHRRYRNRKRAEQRARKAAA